MEKTRKADWLKFFKDAKIPTSSALEYTATFVENRIQFDMLLDLDKDYLNAMGITLMGDIIAILRHAKVCHSENTKKTILAKHTQPAKTTSTVSSGSELKSNSASSLKPKTNIKSSTGTVERSVQLKKNLPNQSITTMKSTVVKNNIVNKPKTVQSKVVSTKIDLKPQKPVLVRSKLSSVKDQEPVKEVAISRKRSSTEMAFVKKHNSSNSSSSSSSSSSSDSESESDVKEITKKMAKKSIFDRLGNQRSGKSVSSEDDPSEGTVSSSTSGIAGMDTPISLVDDDEEMKISLTSPGGATSSYRIPCHSTSSPVEDISRGGAMLDLDQKPTSMEFTVALPPSLTTKSTKSVFDRLGDKTKGSILLTNNTPGKSILKLSSQSLRITKPMSPASAILPIRRDAKSISSMNNKLNLIRSQVNTEGVLAKPANLLKDKVPVRARIGQRDSVTTSQSKFSRPSSSHPTPLKPSVKDRLKLGVTPEKKTRAMLDDLTKKTLELTPANVRTRIEKEYQRNIDRPNGGMGIKLRLGTNKTVSREKIVFDIKSDTRPSSRPEEIVREIFGNDEDDAQQTLDGKKKVRFICVEKKMIPSRASLPRFSSMKRSSAVW